LEEVVRPAIHRRPARHSTPPRQRLAIASDEMWNDSRVAVVAYGRVAAKSRGEFEGGFLMRRSLVVLAAAVMIVVAACGGTTPRTERRSSLRSRRLSRTACR